jgi:hypothetical protein
MPLRITQSVIGVTILIMGYATFWVVNIPGGTIPVIEKLTGVITFACFTALFAWIGLTLYLNYFMLDEVEAIVDPIMHSVRKSHSQERFVTGSLEITRYGGSAVFQWANRQSFPDYDFRDLPRELRVPLKAQFVYLMLGSALGAVSFAMITIFDLHP